LSITPITQDNRRQWLALILSAAAVITLDQISKALILSHIQLGETIPLIGEYLNITLSYNTGAAFGLLPQFGDMFLLVAVVMTVGVFLFYHRIPAGYWIERFALGLVLGGALGNALDRLEHGHVIDWVHVRIPNIVSNVSNFADHAIVIGMIALFIKLWRVKEPTPSDNQHSELPN